MMEAVKPLVFHIRACNFFGGPERQILGHIASSKKYRHAFVTFREGNVDNELEQKCKERGVDVITIATRHSYEVATIFKLREVVKESKPAVICCHGYKPTILTLLAKRGLSVPLIVFSRGVTGENIKVKFFEFLEFQTLRFADVIVAVSGGYANTLLKRGVPKEKLKVILNAIDIDRFTPFFRSRESKRQELGFAAGDFLIATAGRLSPEKAQEDLIISFKAVQKEYPRTHLLLFGDGPLRSHLEQIAVKAEIPQVHFMGHRTDFDSIMPIFNLFVLPSLTEGLPNVLLEAASCNVPIVATKVGGVPEIITTNKSGLLVEPGDQDGLSRAILQLVGDAEMCKEVAKAAFDNIETNFGFSQQTPPLESIYEHLANR